MNQHPVLQNTSSIYNFLQHLKVTILYNNVNEITNGQPQDMLAEEDTVKTAYAILESLKSSGVDAELFEVREDNFTELLTHDTDFYFNICYGIGSLPKTEQEIPKLLHDIGLPFSGAEWQSIELTTDKVATKKIFIKENIPTPDYQLFKSGEDILDKKLKFPLIAKPQMEDCSLGIHNDAVVNNPTQLKNKVKQLYKEYNESVLVEQFINTRELNVTLIGNGNDIEVLPISEIVFGESFDRNKKWKIVDFEAKWEEGSENFKDTVGVCPAVLDKQIENKIKEFAITAYKSCHCRDYARIDIRLDEDNTPYFLEVNLNPGIGPEDGATRSAKVAGYSYSDFLKKLISVSLKRYQSDSSFTN